MNNDSGSSETLVWREKTEQLNRPYSIQIFAGQGGRFEIKNCRIRARHVYDSIVDWEQWVDRFQSKGYRCLAPAWPGRDQPIEVLRQRHPDPQLGQLTLRDVLEHLTDFIKRLDEKPIIVGHSMGGLITHSC